MHGRTGRAHTGAGGLFELDDGDHTEGGFADDGRSADHPSRVAGGTIDSPDPPGFELAASQEA
ncbi:MAG: hypothetical protein ABIZ05_08080 [Pseudonocardiaceae bacterium]